MSIIIRILCIFGLGLLLQACGSSTLGSSSSGSSYSSNDRADNYQSGQARHYRHRGQKRYYDLPARQSKPSYHFENRRSPVAHKDRDLQWIKQQQPGHYTIEMGGDEKRAAVSRMLHKSPKKARSAQFGYKKNEKKHYGGVYGTYDSPQAAQEALESLPPEVRGSAKVSKWQKVQAKAKNNGGNSVQKIKPPTIPGAESSAPTSTSTDY